MRSALKPPKTPRIEYGKRFYYIVRGNRWVDRFVSADEPTVKWKLCGEMMMRDCTVLRNKPGEHIATIGFNEALGLWQIVIANREEMEFFCPSKDAAFAAWHDEFDAETGFPKSTATSPFDA